MKTDKEITKEVAAYLCSLPDGSNLTMYQALEAICPEATKRFDKLDFSLIYKIEEAVNKTGEAVLDFSSHANKCEGLLYNLDFYVRKKNQ